MEEPIFPEAPITAIVCLVFILFVSILQSYDEATPCPIACKQEKALILVNAFLV
jgi:hypothetical protein